MADVTLDAHTLEMILTQARLHPPRDMETQYALDDADQALRSVVMVPGAGQQRLF